MIRMILRRLLISVLVLLVVSILVFVATLLLPGDPARAILGTQATPERIAALQEHMHLNVPVWQRYFDWLSGVLTGDLGFSTSTQGSVNTLLADRIGASLVLLIASAVISAPIGLVVGTWSAIRAGRTSDHVVSGFSLVIAALPEFVIGVALVVLFSTSVFKLLPSVTLSPPGTPVWERPAQLVLPVLTLVLVVTPYIVRMMRATMIEVLASGSVEMARLKGIPERIVLFRHALPQAIGPVAQVIAIQLAWLAGGVVVVEFLFRYPGIGAALIDAVNNRDVQVVQAITLLIAGVYVVVNLLADVVGIVTNPRLRSEVAK
ncbi:ABC transporter permease [Sciscionella sediminilitoris]|uniref:ABC transporter permease n=1 Tax=Sciscionella sediminilitoris TaxID=1445613 RepID=UPI0004DF8E53|nr:ABC transporter permease [Sciscionella sp. SE31]